MVLKRFLFFLCLSTLAPHSVWGSSSERTQQYLQQAQAQRLFEDSSWIKLGHYHKSWNGHWQSQIKGDFFISPTGALSPEAELLASIETLFHKNPRLQCRYLARTRWIQSVLAISSKDLIPCPERDLWKKQLSAQEVYLIFASGDLNSPSSSFGHTFLKLHNPKNTGNLELLDYGVNFAAITGKDTGALFALKGLFGFYPGSYSMLPYHQKIREYTNLEGRDVWEYKLKFSAEEVALLVDHLLELDGSFSYYYFADENCSYQILEILNVLRPELSLTQGFHDFVIPLDTLRLLDKENLLSDEKVRSSLQAEWRRRFADLKFRQKEELKDLLSNPQQFQLSSELDKKSKAEVLEASLSYLAIKEYREQKELKSDKYALALQRAQLGLLTEPIHILPPSSPLLSTEAQALYWGFGQKDQKNYIDLKYRRAFHDLLSDETGLSSFFHLELMSFEFRYFYESHNLDLAHWTFLNVLATAPINILDRPLSWNLDLGTKPKLSPYFDFGAGTSWDLSQTIPTRWVSLGRLENRIENEKYTGFLGWQNILISQWTKKIRSIIDVRYLYSAQEHHFFWDQEVGVSYSTQGSEWRFQYKNRRSLADGLVSYVYFF